MSIGDLFAKTLKNVFEGLEKRQENVIPINARNVEEAKRIAEEVAKRKGWKKAVLIVVNKRSYYVARTWEDFLEWQGILRGFDRFFGVYRTTLEEYQIIRLFV